MQEGPTIRIGLVAEIADYRVTIVGDSVTVAHRDSDPQRPGAFVATQQVTGLARVPAPAGYVLLCLQASPSSHSAPSAFVGSEQVLLAGLQVPASWH